MLNKIFNKELISLIQKKEKTVDIKPFNALNEIISFTNESENRNILQTLILDPISNDFYKLKYAGYHELSSSDFLHYYDNTSSNGINKCQCEKCLQLYYLMELETNWKWIYNNWKSIKQLLETEKKFLIFYILQIEELESIRCEKDNKLLFKKITKKAIQIKCGWCKDKHIIKFPK